MRGTAAAARDSHRLLGLGIVAVLLVSGCGGAKPRHPSDRQAVAAIVTRYLSALAAGNGPLACKLMTASYQSRVVHAAADRCPATLSTLAYDLSPSEKGTLMNARIARTKISGDTASVRVTGEKGSARLTRQRSGGWLLSGGTSG